MLLEKQAGRRPGLGGGYSQLAFSCGRCVRHGCERRLGQGGSGVGTVDVRDHRQQQARRVIRGVRDRVTVRRRRAAARRTSSGPCCRPASRSTMRSCEPARKRVRERIDLDAHRRPFAGRQRRRRRTRGASARASARVDSGESARRLARSQPLAMYISCPSGRTSESITSRSASSRSTGSRDPRSRGRPSRRRRSSARSRTPPGVPASRAATAMFGQRLLEGVVDDVGLLALGVVVLERRRGRGSDRRDVLQRAVGVQVEARAARSPAAATSRRAARSRPRAHRRAVGAPPFSIRMRTGGSAS